MTRRNIITRRARLAVIADVVYAMCKWDEPLTEDEAREAQRLSLRWQLDRRPTPGANHPDDQRLRDAVEALAAAIEIGCSDG